MDYEPAIALIRSTVPHVAAIYLFGSRARSLEIPGSDIDLAILGRRPMAPLDRWDLQERIAATLHADVDLVDLLSASAVMRVQVLGGSRLLLDQDRPARERFEGAALSDYARLNEERRGILDDIRARGSVRG